MLKSELRKEMCKISNFIVAMLLPIFFYVILYLFSKNSNLNISIVEYITYIFQMFFTIVLIIKSSTIFINEITNNTIKILVKSTSKRYKIIISKMIVLFLMFLTCSLLTIFTQIIFCKINNILIISICNIFKAFILYSIPCIFITYFSFFLSIIISNLSISAVSSLIIFILGPTIFDKMMLLNIRIVEYSFLPYLDFYVIRNNLNEINYIHNTSLSIERGIICLLLTLIVMYIASSICLAKKDIN